MKKQLKKKHQNGIGTDARVAECGKVIATILPYGEIKCDGWCTEHAHLNLRCSRFHGNAWRKSTAC